MKLKLVIIIILLFFFIKPANCVENLTLIEKRAFLIKLIIVEYPDIKDQAIEYVCSTKDLVSQDLNKLHSYKQIKKYAVFIRYLCYITLHLYDNGYNNNILELQDCHTRHISNWQNVFF